MTKDVRHTCVECLVAISRHHGLDLSVATIVHEFAMAGEVSPQELVRIASHSGLKAQFVEYNWRKLRKLGQAFPVLIYLRSGTCGILSGFDEDGNVIMLDPLDPEGQPAHLTGQRNFWEVMERPCYSG